jgi:RNA polymerase sigma-70 factor (ECF subfamily)
MKDEISIDKVDFMLSNQENALNTLAEEQLMQLIQSLPSGYRIVFNMYVIEGYSHKEIAEHLGVSESTSKSQFLRARKYLQEVLNKIEQTSEQINK